MTWWLQGSQTPHPEFPDGLLVLFWAPGTTGRARVVLGPCFRVGLECICVSMCPNLSAATRGSRPRGRCPPGRPRGPPPADSTRGGQGQVCPPTSVQQGAAALHGEAVPHPRSSAAGGGRTGTSRDTARPRVRLPQPQNTSPSPERETEAQKRGGRLLRSPKSQSQISRRSVGKEGVSRR